jgi:hypothetical protein
MKKELIGLADAAGIAKMKKDNKDGVFFIECNEHIGYFRNPTRHDVNAALAMADDQKPLAVAEKFGELLFIGGSKEVLINDAMFMGAAVQLRSKLNGIPASMGNL